MREKEGEGEPSSHGQYGVMNEEIFNTKGYDQEKGMIKSSPGRKGEKKHLSKSDKKMKEALDSSF